MELLLIYVIGAVVSNFWAWRDGNASDKCKKQLEMDTAQLPYPSLCKLFRW